MYFIVLKKKREKSITLLEMFISIFLAKRKKKTGRGKKFFSDCKLFCYSCTLWNEICINIVYSLFWEKKKEKAGHPFGHRGLVVSHFHVQPLVCHPWNHRCLFLSVLYHRSHLSMYVCMYVRFCALYDMKFSVVRWKLNKIDGESLRSRLTKKFF